tara:strand:+ start:84 stop:425 length:342 start_codon:yes stop_codon:yes gene_type:complete
MAVNFTTVGVDVGGEYITAKAWARFNIDSSPSINGGYGFSGLQDKGTGWVSLDFTVNQPNIYYSCTMGCGNRKVLNQDGSATLVDTLHMMVRTPGASYTTVDEDRCFVTVHGD